MTPDQRLFDVREGAEYLNTLGAKGVTVATVRGLISSGEIQYVRIGKKFYMSKTAIDTWLARCERRRRE